MEVGIAAHCAVCGKACRKLRCSQCRKVNYCSVDCQRTDWHAGHKSKCAAAAAPSPQAAWGELQQNLMQMSPQEAHQRFQMAQDEIKRLEEEEKKVKVTAEEPQKSRAGTKVEETKPSAVNKDEKMIDSSFSFPLTEKDLEAKTVIMNEECLPHDRDWIYVVEEMPNISSYQVTLWPKAQFDTLPDPNELKVSMQHSRQGNTVVSLCLGDAMIFSARFPGRLEESRNVVQRQSDCLSLRLRCRDSFDDLFSDNSNETSLTAVRSICCRYCDQALLAETAQGIQKVLPLPRGYWDDVTDYLICYNGQPAVDFSSSSTSAQEHLALEDSAVLVLHCNNVGNGICVLAVEGYGEESGEANDPDKVSDSATFRGPRAWRDSVGGATLCCSQCCAVVGFATLASPETFRLLKHRLSAKNDMEWGRVHTCASFVAHEIVRYAESKAIYTFVVAVRSEGTMNPRHSKCILLKLLSWDTRQAKSKDSSSFKETDLLDFKRVVKVIYEITNDRDEEHDAGDPMKWTWGGVDLCCLPDGTRVQQTQTDVAEQAMQSSAASVRLWLSQEEWDKLHEGLVESSKYFSKAVTDATILVKLGPRKEKKSDDVMVGLGALPLL